MKITINQLTIKGLALVLIIYSNVCFYNLDTQAIFLIMNISAGLLTIFTHKWGRIKLTKPLIWLTAIFSMFIISGVLRDQTGSFNLDRFVVSYYQCVLFYIHIRDIVRSEEYEKKLAFAFGSAAFLCILTMYIKEGSFIGRELRSVGSTLSGNVNTVGMALGVLSLFMIYYYGISRKTAVLISAIIVMTIMMLTGSKKVIVYIIANVFTIYSFSKNKTNGKIVMITLFSIIAYLLFGNEYFYNLLGARIIDMLGQMGFHISNAHYSYSTQVRMYMIGEAFHMWLQNPIIGGGTNYFQAHTATLYEYSHCNVTELLCSFGVIGCLIYYIPHISFIRHYKRMRNINENIAHFLLILVVLTLIIDWMAVTFSSFSTVYIPIIFVLVMMERVCLYR